MNRQNRKLNRKWQKPSLNQQQHTQYQYTNNIKVLASSNRTYTQPPQKMLENIYTCNYDLNRNLSGGDTNLYIKQINEEQRETQRNNLDYSKIIKQMQKQNHQLRLMNNHLIKQNLQLTLNWKKQTHKSDKQAQTDIQQAQSQTFIYAMSNNTDGDLQYFEEQFKIYQDYVYEVMDQLDNQIIQFKLQNKNLQLKIVLLERQNATKSELIRSLNQPNIQKINQIYSDIQKIKAILNVPPQINSSPIKRLAPDWKLAFDSNRQKTIQQNLRKMKQTNVSISRNVNYLDVFKSIKHDDKVKKYDDKFYPS